MADERTEIEWPYQPADYFEAPYRYRAGDFELVIEGGKAVATLAVPHNPVPLDLESRITGAIEGAFLVRQLQTHRPFRLEGSRTYQYADGRKHVFMPLSGTLTLTGQLVNVIVTGPDGQVIRDLQAERIAEDTAMLDAVVSKIAASPALRGMLESYGRAVGDPGDELVHLYEVRDALAKHFDGETSARQTMGISKADWQRLGSLANFEPIDQGRHRGQHSAGRRAATPEELREARELVKRWMVAFADRL